MTHDVFISYSRHDVEWAKKMEQNLKNRGLRVIRDENRIAAGDEWEETLRDAIVECQSLLVLWSGAAAQSKWVMKEQESFRQMMHVDSREGKPSIRRLVQICLDSTSPEYAEFQTVSDLYKANSYAGGAANADPDVWSRAVEKVAERIAVDTNLPKVHQVILASTQQSMQALSDDSKAVPDAASYADLITGLNFVSKQELLTRYGSERSEWRPFGGQKSILTILSELREELLSRGTTPFLWKPVSEDDWSSPENKRRLRERLYEEACVIVLDAVSLYDPTIQERYSRLVDCLQNPKAAIVVLPPYASRERPHLRAVLEAAAAKMFETFYQLDRISLPIAASCSLMADDPYEVSRVVASMMRVAFGKEKNAKLRFGAARP